jgi:hypothetical protein
MSQNLDNIPETSKQGLNFSETQEALVDSSVSPSPISAVNTAPFISRFNQWMKAIAIVVICTFVPDQISWAFGYNPAVLYRNLPIFGMQDASMPMSKPALQIAGSLEYLLKQIQDRPKLHLQLNLDQANNDANANSSGVIASNGSSTVIPAKAGIHTLDIDTKTVFTADKINQITQWLNTPNINVLNCGVYSLKDILEANGIKRSLSEISVMTLSVDIMADIIKIGEPKLKTTLFAINKTAKALGLDYQSLKVTPQDELKLKMPFIAHFKNEHFVTVQKAVGGKVYYTDLDYPRIVDQQDFLNNADGFVFAQPPVIASSQTDSVIARSPKGDEAISYKLIPEPLQAFVWGDKWRDRSKDLPGIVTGSQLTLQICIWVATIVLACLPAISSAMSAASNVTQVGADVANPIDEAGTTMANLGEDAAPAAGDGVSLPELTNAGNLTGDTSAVWGDASRVYGNATGITGDVSGLTGNISSLNVVNGMINATPLSQAIAVYNNAISKIYVAMDESVFSLELSQLTNTLETIYEMKHPGSQDQVFILGTAIDAAISMGAGEAGNLAGSATSVTASQVALNVGEAVAVGFAFGLLKGYVELEITKAVDNAFCPPSQQTCSDEGQILEAGVGMIANSVGSTLAVAAVASLSDNAFGTNFGQYFGLGTTKAQQNGKATVTAGNQNALVKYAEQDPDAIEAGLNAQNALPDPDNVPENLWEATYNKAVIARYNADNNVNTSSWSQQAQSAWYENPNNVGAQAAGAAKAADTAAFNKTINAGGSKDAAEQAGQIAGIQAGQQVVANQGITNYVAQQANIIASANLKPTPGFTLAAVSALYGGLPGYFIDSSSTGSSGNIGGLPPQDTAPTFSNTLLQGTSDNYLISDANIPENTLSPSQQAFKNANAYVPLSFGAAMSKTIIGDNTTEGLLPLVAGQLTGMAARLVLLKEGNVKATDALSTGVGGVFNALGAVGGQYLASQINNQNFPKAAEGRGSPGLKWWQPLEGALMPALTRSVIALGLGMLQQYEIGAYNQKEAQSDPTYAYNYSYKVGQYQALSFMASSVITAGAFAQFPSYFTVSSNNQNPASIKTDQAQQTGAAPGWWDRFDLALLSPTGPTGVQEFSYGMNPILQGAGLPDFMHGANDGNTSLYHFTSPQTFVDFSDSLDQMSGVTANWAVSADNMWKEMKAGQSTYNQPQRSIGGLIEYMPATPASNASLRDQFVLSMFQSRMIGAPGINIDFINNVLTNANISAEQKDMGQKLGFFFTSDKSRSELASWGLGYFYFDRATFDKNYLYIGQGNAQGGYLGTDLNNDQVSIDKSMAKEYTLQFLFPNLSAAQINQPLSLEGTVHVSTPAPSPTADLSTEVSSLMNNGLTLSSGYNSTTTSEEAKIKPITADNGDVGAFELTPPNPASQVSLLGNSVQENFGVDDHQKAISNILSMYSFGPTSTESAYGLTLAASGTEPAFSIPLETLITLQAMNMNTGLSINGSTAQLKLPVAISANGALYPAIGNPAASPAENPAIATADLAIGGTGKVTGMPEDDFIRQAKASGQKIMGESVSNGKDFTVDYSILPKSGLSQTYVRYTNPDKTGWNESIYGKALPIDKEDKTNPNGSILRSGFNLEYFDLKTGQEIPKAYFQGVLDAISDKDGIVLQKKGYLNANGALTAASADTMLQGLGNLTLKEINPEIAAELSGDKNFQTVTGLVAGVGGVLANSGSKAMPVTVSEQIGSRLGALPDDNGNNGGKWLTYFEGTPNAGKNNNETIGGMLAGGDFDISKDGKIVSAGNGTKAIYYAGQNIGGFQNIFNLTQNRNQDAMAAIIGFPGFEYNGQTGTSQGRGEIYTYLNNVGSQISDVNQTTEKSNEPNVSMSDFLKKIFGESLNGLIGNGTVAAVKPLGAGVYEANGEIAPGALFKANANSFMPDMVFKVDQGNVIQKDASGQARMYTVDNLASALAASQASTAQKSFNGIQKFATGDLPIPGTKNTFSDSAEISDNGTYVAGKTEAGVDLDKRIKNAGIVVSFLAGQGMPSVFLDRSTLILGKSPTSMPGENAKFSNTVQVTDTITPGKNGPYEFYSQGKRVTSWDRQGTEGLKLKAADQVQMIDGKIQTVPFTLSASKVALDSDKGNFVFQLAKPVNSDGSPNNRVFGVMPAVMAGGSDGTEGVQGSPENLKTIAPYTEILGSLPTGERIATFDLYAPTGVQSRVEDGYGNVTEVSTAPMPAELGFLAAPFSGQMTPVYQDAARFINATGVETEISSSHNGNPLLVSPDSIASWPFGGSYLDSNASWALEGNATKIGNKGAVEYWGGQPFVLNGSHASLIRGNSDWAQQLQGVYDGGYMKYISSTDTVSFTPDQGWQRFTAQVPMSTPDGYFVAKDKNIADIKTNGFLPQGMFLKTGEDGYVNEPNYEFIPSADGSFSSSYISVFNALVKMPSPALKPEAGPPGLENLAPPELAVISGAGDHKNVWAQTGTGTVPNSLSHLTYALGQGGEFMGVPVHAPMGKGSLYEISTEANTPEKGIPYNWETKEVSATGVTTATEKINSDIYRINNDGFAAIGVDDQGQRYMQGGNNVRTLINPGNGSIAGETMYVARGEQTKREVTLKQIADYFNGDLIKALQGSNIDKQQLDRLKQVLPAGLDYTAKGLEEFLDRQGVAFSSDKDGSRVFID